MAIRDRLTFLLDLYHRDFFTLEDLRPYKIGMTRGAAISPEFDSANYLHKEKVKHDSLNVKKLLKGRVDLVFEF